MECVNVQNKLKHASFFQALHLWSSGIFSKPTGISNIPYPYPNPYISGYE